MSKKSAPKLSSPKANYEAERQAGRETGKALKEAGLKKYNGMTAKQFRAKHSKFKAGAAVATRSGNFEVWADYRHSPTTQKVELPNEAAALARLDRIRTNPDVRIVKVVELIPRFTRDGQPDGMKTVVLYQFNKTDQEFANSEVLTFYKHPVDGSILSTKQVLQSPKLSALALENKLEVAYRRPHGGKAWWDQSREDRTVASAGLVR